MRGLASFTRSTAPSNGMDAKSSAAVPLSSPAAAQRCAEGAGLDGGARGRSTITRAVHRTRRSSQPQRHRAEVPMNAFATPRIYTSLTDATVATRRASVHILSRPIGEHIQGGDVRPWDRRARGTVNGNDRRGRACPVGMPPCGVTGSGPSLHSGGQRPAGSDQRNARETLWSLPAGAGSGASGRLP